MTEEEQKKLGEILWEIADQLRGAMDANDFKDYMLSFLFLNYLSENYQKEVQKTLGADYPTLTEGEHITPLQKWYEKTSMTDIQIFEEAMRRKLHYTIEPKYLWGNIAKMAKRADNDLLNTLRKGFRHIENESFDRAFQGLFSEINLDSEKLGRDYDLRNKKLCSIIGKIDEKLSDFTRNSDHLGDAYEYLLEQFAADSGKKAGEFYTPQQISSILSEIVTLDSQAPEQGKKPRLENVLDFACGSGSLLLNIRHKLGANGIGKIHGQEKNITTYNLARMNMLLHGVKDTQFEIFHGDTLTNEWDLLREENPAKKIKFDAVVANPPFSYRWEADENLSNDMRFKNYGLAPKSAADFAFLLHGFHFLNKEGIMAIILPHGVLFRGGAEKKIREKLLKDNHIDTVIGLPANLFHTTGIPVCILVLKKCKKFDDVLFINAKEEYEKGKKQNLLKNMDRIIDFYKYRKEEEYYAKRISMAKIEAEDYNLNISRYVNTEKPEAEIDLTKVHEEITGLQEKIKTATEKHNSFLKELGLPLLP